MPRYLYSLLLCLTVLPLPAQEQLSVVAQPGDGIYKLLRAYQLVEYGCNIDEFRRLNGMQSSALYVGRAYQLPLQIYTYNGRSIRSTTGNDDYARALAIQHYNEALLAAGARERDFREDQVLYVPHHLDACPLDQRSEGAPTEIVYSGELPERPTVELADQPTTSDFRTFDILGSEHAFVPLVDNQLAGRIFYLVAGHGGPDPGAVGKRAGHTLYEDEYAYDVTLRLCRNILAHGGTPYMIVRDENDGIRDQQYLAGDKDEVVWGGAPIPRGQKTRLFQRSDAINALYDENLARGITDQTMLCIHVDSRHRGKRIDLFFYHYPDDLIGAKRAERLHRTIQAKYDQHRPGRGYAGTIGGRDLHMLRETKPSGVYIELANIANPTDQQRIILPKNRQLLADWLLMGLLD